MVIVIPLFNINAIIDIYPVKYTFHRRDYIFPGQFSIKRHPKRLEENPKIKQFPTPYFLNNVYHSFGSSNNA